MPYDVLKFFALDWLVRGGQNCVKRAEKVQGSLNVDEKTYDVAFLI